LPRVPQAGRLRGSLPRDETGFIEGRNVAIEYRFADEAYDRLPALAADYRFSVLVGTMPLSESEGDSKHGGDPVHRSSARGDQNDRDAAPAPAA
jgi:hypothetical protein